MMGKRGRASILTMPHVPSLPRQVVDRLVEKGVCSMKSARRTRYRASRPNGTGQCTRVLDLTEGRIRVLTPEASRLSFSAYDLSVAS